MAAIALMLALAIPASLTAQDTTAGAVPVGQPAIDTVNIQHLALSLDGTSLPGEPVQGTARYRLRTGEESPRTLRLRAADLEVAEVRLALSDSSFSIASYRQTAGDSLVIPIEQPIPSRATFELAITYSATPGPGLQVHTTSDGALQAAWTSGIPGTNRYWFPTFERLTDTFTSELTVTLPAPLRLVTSGRRVPTSDETDESETFHFRFDHPLVSHEIGFTAGEYESVRSSFDRNDGEPVVLEYLVPPDRIGDARRTFRRTPEVMSFLSEQLRVPYPYPSVRQAVVPGIRPACIQPPMTVILPDSLIVNQRANHDFPAHYDVARATAEQWIGSVLSPKTWADVWITRGLSAYLAVRFIQETSGEDDAHLAISDLERRFFARFPSHSIPLAPSMDHEPVDLLAEGQRARGARVFQMLHHRLGDEQFRSALQRLVTDDSTRVVTTQNLREAFETVGGQSLGTFFEQWVYGAGYPALQLSYGFNASIDSVSIHVEQRQNGDAVSDVFHLNLPLTIHGLTGRQDVSLDIDQRDEVLAVSSGSEPRFLELDPQNVVADSSSVVQQASAWVRQLNEGQTVTSRIRAAREARQFADDPSLAIGLRGALESSSHPAVRAAIVRTMGVLPPSGTISSAIREALSSPSSTVRRASLVAIRGSESPTRARKLAMTAAQNDTSYQVQATAIRTLASLGGENTIRVLQSAFVTPSHNEVIRRAAFDALAIVDAPLPSTLPLALKWSERGVPPAVRSAAPGFLAGHLDNSGARQRMMELLRDPSVRVRTAAARALGRQHSDRSGELLQQRLEEEKHPWVRRALQHALQARAASQ